MLQATAQMRRVVEGLIEDGRITQSLHDYAVAQGYSDADIIAKREAVRQSTARLEIQGKPHIYKSRLGQGNPGDPTPERQTKMGSYMTSQTVGRGETVPVKRYRLRSIMEMHGDKFIDEQRLAFAAFIGDVDLHQRIRVADMNSSGGGGVQRLGGLGNVPQHIRDRHARYEWVSKRLTACEKEVVDVLVVHALTRRDGSPFGVIEFGQMIFPMINDQSFLRGAALSGFRNFVSHLAELYRNPECPRVRLRAAQLLDEGV